MCERGIAAAASRRWAEQWVWNAEERESAPLAFYIGSMADDTMLTF